MKDLFAQEYKNTGKPNDYIDCYYSRSLSDTTSYPQLDSEISTAVCVIGGGLAGISTALGLAQRGIKPVLVESNRVGWGASGRNGGFLAIGYSQCPLKLVKSVGVEHAKDLFGLTQSAYQLIQSRLKGVEKEITPAPHGITVMSWFDDQTGVHSYVDKMNDIFDAGYEFLPREKVREMYNTPRYYDGYLKPGLQINSLKYARHTANMACELGAQIFEKSGVEQVSKDSNGKWRVKTATGTVIADQIVYSCSAYIKGLHPKLARATLPVATYVLLTEPLGDRMQEAIRVPYAASDDRTSSNYYRPLADGRLLWGGRVSMFHPSQEKLKHIMMKDLLHVYPQLKGIKAEVAWGGHMGYAKHKMPQIGQLEPGVWHCQGFGGHGMCSTTVGGEAVAAAIAGSDERYKLFAPFGLDYAGKPFGPIIAQSAYWGFQAQDKIREWRLNRG
tara:strand:+ start:35202 stop:36533 length:1332 start_codon:yes stop_codon:yes gene_type:complete